MQRRQETSFALESSLAQKIKGLRRLQALNRAEIAMSAKNNAGFPKKSPRHTTRQTFRGRRDDG
jgi:hypothetical protein